MAVVASRSTSDPAGTRGRRVVLALVVACLLSACALGDIFNGPAPVDVTDQQIIGTWEGQEGAGTFVFAADGTLSAKDLPADALPPLPATHRWSCVGRWRITSPVGGNPDQRNIVELDLRGLAGVDGGYGGRMSASMPNDVIVLTVGSYSYLKK